MTKEISPSRVFAFSILKRLESGESNSAELLAEVQERMQPADRSLCHAIVLGVLRRQLMLDRIIGSITREKRLDSEVRVILRLSIFQLKFLDRVPDYAVVNDAVNLAVKAGKASARGLVNAVLRRFLRGDFTIGFTDALDELSAETSHPRWLLEKWVDDFGAEDAELIARANRSEPDLSFRLTPKSIERGFSEGDFEGAGPEDLIRFSEEGLIYLQDRGSQIVAESVNLKVGETFLDLCAAPGGKSGMIALRNPGACVIAGDINLRRAKRMKSIFQRQNSLIPVVVLDTGSGLPFDDGFFDCILVDAPCTGTGTIRRNPEIPLRITKQDLIDSSKRQLQILESVVPLLRSGGRLLYSTCSLEREENEDVCEEFISRNPGLLKERLTESEKALAERGFLRTFPQVHGTDGFFISSFLKK